MRRAGFATFVLLAPACLLFGVFVVYPIVANVALSFYDWNGVGERVFVGLANYRELFSDHVFATALGNNLRWLACYLIAPLAGLGLAMLLSQDLPGMRLARSLFFMPFVLSQVVVGLVFGWFFHPRYGLFDGLLRALDLPPVSLLDSERWALFAMILAGLWPQTAYCMILYVTGLATLRGDTVDAARVDGARGLALFRGVVLPQLRGVNFIVAMVCAVAALRSFDYVMVMTLGGPFDSSTVLAFYMYEQTFVASRYGYGAAIATVLLALMSGIIVALLWRLLRRERS
ncbi:MAG TPA: sugar ABC transporter permease [Casimicrobiaceae bacterium]|nr:sugar ABC transporter permease [Casimicrobiaceae bacterium]